MKKLRVIVIVILVFITLIGSIQKKNNLIEGGKTNLLFNVNDGRNQQGLTYGDDSFYIGFDVGDNQGEIVKYSITGDKISSTGKIKIGHAAGLAFREKNHMIYVANGGKSNPTHIYEVDFDNKYVTKDINLEQYGTSALLAIDNDLDRIILHSSQGGDTGKITFNIIDFNGNKLEPQFEIPNQGIPQGLEYYKGILYYYTNNTVTCIDIKTHTIIDKFNIDMVGESEGITLVKKGTSPYLAIGYNKNNRIYSIKSN